jgi:hypothetical protein
MRTISQVLDRAREVQKVPSDYKLGLCLGIGGNSLSNYRTGKSLPDEKAAAKLASAIGEKPDLLLVEIQAQRVKDPDARAMWENLAKRLQAGFADVSILMTVAMVSIAALALPHLLALFSSCLASNGLYIMLSNISMSMRHTQSTTQAPERSA